MKVTIMGLGLFGGGLGAARHFAEQGHEVTVTDLADAAKLAPSLARLADLAGIRYVLGRHDEADVLGADLLVVSPAVPPTQPLLRARREAGLPVTSEIECFLRAITNPVVAVTGSNGKTTTTAMLGRLLAERGLDPLVGGNIGGSLLPELEGLARRPERIVVLELSSFQLESLALAGRPVRGVILTNLAPNHLDRHGDFAAYRAAKLRLLDFCAAGAPFVCDAEDPGSRDWPAEARARGLRPRPVGAAELEATPQPRLLLGRFNRKNLALAATLADAVFGPDDQATARGAASFRGLPHRLETLGRLGDLIAVNDSKSTTPFATAAAVAALDRPPRLIAGGHDKGLDPEEYCAVFERCERVVLFGATAESLLAAWTGRPRASAVRPVVARSLAEAIDLAAAEASGPGYLLLSPGHPSYDRFPNYERRGEAFRAELGRRADFRPADEGSLTSPPAFG